ncbi:hypothetical protein [Cupriavidus basilensis]|uniref:hypothetical protein n=1 Tax=Cupriavidus basilensis TaxID=68895 RepID=UPI0023E77D5D|nr:hypothetical protein [Cupriavidus basilensis]MDF3886694.1 hypothetical protein [Cupriavidus basilensis]
MPLSQPALWRGLLQGELDAARQALAASQARQEEGTRQIETLERQLQDLRTQFSTDLERTREQVAVAQKRAGVTERRPLREIDQERTRRQKGEQAVADLRLELAAVQARAQHAAVAGAEARARLQAERAQAEATATRRMAATKRHVPATKTKFKPGPA